MANNPNYNFLERNWQKHRVFVLQGGTRSGKTYSVLHFIIRLCIKYKDAGIVITLVRKTLPSLKGSAYRDFIQLLKDYQVYSEWQHNKSELIYSLFGNTVEFISVDQPQKLRGRKRHILFVNEANELDIEDWRQLMFRTTAKAIIDFNPSITDEHWIVQDVQKRNDAATIITTYKDNNYLSKGQIEEIERLREQHSEYWKVFGMGQFGELFKGLIYRNWKEYDSDPKGVRLFGLDFGFSNDPCALVELIVNGNDVYCKEHIYQTGLTNTDLIRLMKTINIGHAPIYYDNASPDRGTEVFRAGFNAIPARKGQGSIIAGISMLQSKNLFIHRESLNLKKELRSYSYQTDKSGNALPEPVDYLNHCFIGSTLITTNKGQVAIQDIQEGDYVLTSKGYKEVVKKWDNGLQQISTYSMQLDTYFVSLECTSNHSIKTENAWTPISHLKCNQNLFLYKCSMVSNTNFIKGKDTLAWGIKGFIQKFGSITKGQSQKITTYIMWIITHIIMIFQILTSFIKHFMQGLHQKKDLKKTPNMQNYSNLGELKLQKNGIIQKKENNGTRNTVKKVGTIGRILNTFARNVGLLLNQEKQQDHHTAILTVKLNHIEESNVRKERVYDLTIKDEHEYFANGVLVHNCLDSLRYALFTYSSVPLADTKPRFEKPTRYPKPTR